MGAATTEPRRPGPPALLLGTASLVAGVLGIGSFWFYGVGGLLGLVAIVVAVLALRGNGRPTDQVRALATGGVVTGGLAVGITLALFAFGTFISNEIDDVFGDADLGGLDTEFDDGGINSDPPDGVCDEDRFLQDPDC